MRLSELRDSFHRLLNQPRKGFLARFFAKRSEWESLQAWNTQLLQAVADQQATLDAFNATLVEHERRTIEQAAQLGRLQEGLAAWEELRQPLRVLGAQVSALAAHATAAQSELARLSTGLVAERDQAARSDRELQAQIERDRRALAELNAGLRMVAEQLQVQATEFQSTRESIGQQITRHGADHAALAEALRDSAEVARAHAARSEATLAQLTSQLGRINANVMLEFAQFKHETVKLEDQLTRQTAVHAGFANELKTTADFARALAAHADASMVRMRDEVGKLAATRTEITTLQQIVTQKLGPQLDETSTKVREIDGEVQRHTLRLAKLFAERGPDDPELFDRFYLAFENQFRGTPAEVKAKTQPYLPAIKKVAAAAGPKSWVDLGCGRGEWLEQLAALGVEPVGVDTNTSMLQVCRDRGLKVVEADVLAYIQTLPAGSLLGVSAFHLIEHLPYRTLLALMNAVARAIKPGGCLILETPNPQNVSVGACNFYMDLTHQKPIPPMTTEFLVRHAGFREVKVLRLSPYERYAQRDSLPTVTDREYCEMFYGPRDYGIIAIK